MSSGPWLCQLWMGGLEAYMTETFIRNAFEKLGETPQSVKVMRNKFTGEPAGYCFVHFATDEMALDAMHKLNGKIIPASSPPVRFKLNHASTTGKLQNEQEFSLWIGDLSPEVDDYQLYRLFASRYHSIRTAKVILDASGVSKGYGFVRFANEEDQRSCLIDMNGYKGLGNKPLKISNAIPKSRLAATEDGGTNDNSTTAQTSYYEQYWQNYQTWQQQQQQQGYTGYYDQYTSTADYNQSNYDQQTAAAVAAAAAAARAIEQQPPLPTEKPPSPNDDFQLVEYKQNVDIAQWNNELTNRDAQMWDAIMDSKWLPVEVP